jgi:hypothetical protein
MAVSKLAADDSTPKADIGEVEDIPLVVVLLRGLQPLIKNATIELRNGTRVSVQDGAPEDAIQFHCSERDAPCTTPCKDVFPIEYAPGEVVGICKTLAVFGCSTKVTNETERRRQSAFERIEKAFQKLRPREKASLLAAFGEEGFKAFLDENRKLEDLQSIHYWFRHRINKLKSRNPRSPKRPVREQRKVGDYLYLLQPAQKGGDYWYIHYTTNGVRKQVYLGKATPTFNPQEDLARKEKAKTKTRAAGV